MEILVILLLLTKIELRNGLGYAPGYAFYPFNQAEPVCIICVPILPKFFL